VINQLKTQINLLFAAAATYAFLILRGRQQLSAAGAALYDEDAFP
jgi:hypothetical protein